MKNLFLIALYLVLALPLAGQQPAALLQSGPMVGYTEMREALLWVQTHAPASVYFEYRPEGEKGPAFRTETYQTRKEEAYTARLVADQVQPGTSYVYDLFINGKAVSRPYPTRFKTPPLWHWRGAPPAMRFALGSCSYINEEIYDRPGNAYRGNYEIFESVRQKEPDFMLWLGDNVYLREADWYSRTGILHRYTHTRSTPEMQGLLAGSANYAIWDDHDYGPNNSDHTWIQKETALETFRLFWGNPTHGLPGAGGVTTSFEWGDAQFFLLDNRYFRSPNDRHAGGPRTLLGEQQLKWIVDALASSIATFKFVCIGGQVLNNVESSEKYIHIAPEERNYLLQAIANEGIKNVIFLTGDVHHSELSFLEKNRLAIYDFTVSPMTAGPYDASDEENDYRVADTQYGKRNFGMIEITGERLARKLKFSLYDTDGKQLWEREIEAQYDPPRN